MNSGKNILIITDDGASLELTAQLIKDCAQNCAQNCDVKIRTGQGFAGTDLLPAGIFFLGCNKPAPASFSYLEDMLSHINLASRKCGIFSANKESLEYLAGILRDCEAELGEPLLITDGNDKPAVEKWLKKILG